MREDVRATLIGLYRQASRWQKKRGITFNLTQDEYLALWTDYRIKLLAKTIDRGEAALKAYLRNPDKKPVCGWINRQAREGGVMDASTAKIMSAMDSRRMFQFVAGDQHSPESRAKMRKPKSDNHKAAMRRAALERHARERAERENSND